MIKKICSRISYWKIRTQFALLIFCALIMSFGLFGTLWANKMHFFNFFGLADYCQTYGDALTLADRLYKEAPNYELPESEEDEERIKALEPFLDLADQYTSISIYGLDDGYHRTSRFAEYVEKHSLLFTFYGFGDQLTDGGFEDFRYVPLKFSNGSGSALIMSYKRQMVLYPYVLISLFLSILLFFLMILFFVRRKMRSVLRLEQEILVMSSGNLTRPIPDLGGDEIGILAKELNSLRSTLNDNIVSEMESRKANQDLITALSHDLRTPLTILNGYLEILKLKKNPDMQDEYIDKALGKAKDIKSLTDRMFEYALVSEKSETPELAWISTDYIRKQLEENTDFIRLAGFSADFCRTPASVALESDKTMLKRIFNNLFSNIIKYGDKKHPVSITDSISGGRFSVSIKNAVKERQPGADGNHIGLKNVQTMMHLLGGEFCVSKDDGMFCVTLSFNIEPGGLRNTKTP